MSAKRQRTPERESPSSPCTKEHSPSSPSSSPCSGYHPTPPSSPGWHPSSSSLSSDVISSPCMASYSPSSSSPPSSPSTIPSSLSLVSSNVSNPEEKAKDETIHTLVCFCIYEEGGESNVCVVKGLTDKQLKIFDKLIHYFDEMDASSSHLMELFSNDFLNWNTVEPTSADSLFNKKDLKFIKSQIGEKEMEEFVQSIPKIYEYYNVFDFIKERYNNVALRALVGFT